MRVFRRDDKWWVDYPDPATGRRVRRPAGLTKAEAEGVLANLRSQGLEPAAWKKPGKPAQMLFEDFVPRYMEWARASKRSWERDEGLLRRLAGSFGGKALDEITVYAVDQYKLRRMQATSDHTGRRVSPRQVNYELAVLKTFFNKAIEWEMAKENPVRRVKLLKLNNARTRYLDTKEVQALLDACSGRLAHLRPIVVLALHTGMRRGEILNLRWEDVDYKAGIIHIRQAKNGESRSVPMNEAVLEALRSCVRVDMVVEGKGEGRIFCNAQGKPRIEIRNAFDSALRKAGIKDCHFHDLRHTCASHLVSNGESLTVVQRILGHKTPAMTLRYAHLSPEAAKRAVGKLSEVFWHKEGTRVSGEGGVR